MSNNPGKKGHPAPWMKRERADRARALEEYCTQHHAGYRAWRKARHEVWRKAHAEAEAAFPGPALIGSVLKHEEKLLKAWDRSNPNPMTREERTKLEAEFSKSYVPIDRS